MIGNLREGQFVVEPEFEASGPTVRNTLGIEDLRDGFGDVIDMSDLAPDLIQVLPKIGGLPADRVDVSETVDPLCQRIVADGSIETLSPDDPRLRLRVIDFKMSSEPGSHYFAETAFYSIALAGWLAERGWDDRFVVSAAPGIWSVSEGGGELSHFLEEKGTGGSYDVSEVAQVVDADVDVAPYEVFAVRLKRFFSRELKAVAENPWDELEWHVSAACSYCDFLGHPKVRPPQGIGGPGEKHCWQLGISGDRLCQVAGMPRSGVDLLDGVFDTVAELADSDMDNAVFQRSHSLRAQRHVFPARAQSLLSGKAGLIEGAGTAATMPRWPDLRIYLFLEYDLSTAITAAFGIRASWWEPRYAANAILPQRRLDWNEFEKINDPNFREVHLVQERNVETERQALLKFLKSLKAIMDQAHSAYVGQHDRRSTYQIYIWDDAQRRQLVRVLGRHLAAILEDAEIRDLAWLFPPPELLARPEDVSRTGPLTVVAGVVATTVAAPIRYHYTLLDFAQHYRVGGPSNFDLSWNYQQPLSDLVPAERLYGMWDGSDEPAMRGIEVAVRGKLSALADVVRRLEQDLGDRLERSAAPRLGGARADASNLPLRSRLWLEYNRLNVATQELEGFVIRAMPVHEREARFKSARLTERLEGESKSRALERMETATHLPMAGRRDLVVYRMAETSVDFNARPGDPGYALVPDDMPELFSRNVFSLSRTHPPFMLRPRTPSGTVGEVGLTQYSIENIDRANRLIALREFFRNHVDEMEDAGGADFRENVVLDPVPFDVSVAAIRETLDAIGRPDDPNDTDQMRNALGVSAGQAGPGKGVLGKRVVAHRASVDPALKAGSDFLWDAGRLGTQPCVRADNGDKSALESLSLSLNPSQWSAWEHALTHRASLIWGPPGTGKTRTLAAVVAGALHHAHRKGRGLRVLVTAFTYNAVDTLLADVVDQAGMVLSPDDYRVYRIRSAGRNAYAGRGLRITDVPMGFEVDDGPALRLIDDLDHHRGISVIASVPHQLHNLAKLWNSPNKQRVRDWFDLIVIDEATQLSVALSTLCVSKAAEECTFVLGGDDLQLPPIQPADPPAGSEYMVGSVYGYLRRVHGVDPQPLQVNYRSNRTLVKFVKRAGYDEGLEPWSPDLRMRLEGDVLSREKPSDWPSGLLWSEGLVDLLRPDEPAVCLVYDDPTAGQSNDFEADVVAGMLWLLHGGLKKGLGNELEVEGEGYRRVTDEKHDSESFWNGAVGIVAPHRAQISAITSRLLQVFNQGHDSNYIRGAVDTVERFQGQQRDVIIASFGVGDPDVIASEDEFLYNLNRFNVMVSRARAKLVVLVTQGLLDHLPNALEVVEQSRLVKYFAEGYCGNPRDVTLGTRTGTLRSASMN